MDTAKEDDSNIKYDPPYRLSLEHAKLWEGWHELTDEKVVHQAVSKGSCTDLAINFLSLRRRTEISEAQAFFKTEALEYILKLLDRKQIHRVMHIFRNTNKNPNEELLNIFLSTDKKEIRDYVGDFLLTVGKLKKIFHDSWILLEAVEVSEKRELILGSGSYNLLKVHELAHNYKCFLAGELFLISFDFRLMPFLSPEVLWRVMLMENKIDCLKLWIKTFYSDPDTTCENIQTDAFERLLKLFNNFPISQQMIDMIESSDVTVSSRTKSVVLNELAKYGVFSTTDKSNVLNVLSRLGKIQMIQKFKTVLGSRNSSVDVAEFYSLLIDYCVQREFFDVICVCTSDFVFEDELLQKFDSKYLNLLVDIRHACSHLHDEAFLKDNVLKVANFFSDNLEEYFSTNPLVLLAFITLNGDSNLTDRFLSNETDVSFEDTKINVIETLKQFPVFSVIVKKFSRGWDVQSPSLDSLLDRHSQINFKEFLSITSCEEKVSFSNSDLIKKYGYQKTITFVFYLSQSRPSMAYTIYLGQNCDTSRSKIYNVALEKFLDVDVAASCVAFLEMIGENSQQLRILLECANIIHGNPDYTGCSITNLIKNVHNNKEVILIALEYTIMRNINEILKSTEKFTEVLRRYEVVVKFCRFFDLSLPEELPKYFANNNMWLQFLIFVQIHDYPSKHVMHLIQNFKSPNIVEHITHSIIYDIDHDPQKEALDQKQCLSKLGLSEKADGTQTRSQTCSESSEESTEALEYELMHMKATLLQVLIRCHNSVDPPSALLHSCQIYRYPLLAILATTYEPESVITSWLMWLTVSSNLSEQFTKCELISHCPNSVMDILMLIIKQKYISTLLESLHIFLPENPLRIFIEVLHQCSLVDFDCDQLREKLELFKKKLKLVGSNSIISDIDQDIFYLNNKVWIQRVAIVALAHTLQYSFTSLCAHIDFLKVMIDLHFADVLEKPLDFEKVMHLLEILRENECYMKPDLSVIYDSVRYQVAVKNFVEQLVQKKKYKVALEICKLEDLPPDSVLIADFKNQFDCSKDVSFWENCDRVFEEYKVSPRNAIDFFIQHSVMIEDTWIKYKLLKMAYEWACCADTPDKTSIGQLMWLAFVNVDGSSKISDFDTGVSKKPYSILQAKLSDVQPSNEELSQEQYTKVNETIDFLLDCGNFWEALILERMFACENENLDILKVCSKIAEGQLLPTDLNIKERLLLNNFKKGQGRTPKIFRHKRQSSASVISSHTPTSTVIGLDALEMEDDADLNTIEVLTGKLSSGQDIGYNIFMHYRISKNTLIPYHTLLMIKGDGLETLKEALKADCKNKIDVVHDFLCIYAWDKLKIADFICVELVEAVRFYSKTPIVNLVMWDLHLDVDFHQVLQLLQDNASLLGMTLYSYANALHMSETSSNREIDLVEIVVVVELLIRSHDCFTADCNMEGISLVLKKAQTLISFLTTIKNWQLIVRLLTGIRRYSEMGYALHILRENDQFECLLSKASKKKDNSLKLALIEYLKRYCPDNHELYRMVALHFTLFSEVAQIWEKEAQNIVRNLIAVSKLEMQNNEVDLEGEMFVFLYNTEGTKNCLQKAKDNYVHATEYHLKGEKFAKAMHAARQAEMVALQISRLNHLANKQRCICLLNMDPSQILYIFLTSHLSFAETMIAVEAYNFKVDWGRVLYERCVLGGDMNYFNHFLNHIPLTEGLVHDIARRFSNISYDEDQLKNMTYVLNRLPSIHARFKIAQELNLPKLVQRFAGRGKLAYLQDTVWKSTGVPTEDIME